MIELNNINDPIMEAEDMQRLVKLKNLITEKDLEAVLIYMPVNRRYFSGFTGSAGYALIFRDKNYFLSDFRYIQQSQKQCEGFEIITISIENTLSKILASFNITKLGIEDNFMDVAAYLKLKQDIPDIEMTGIGKDLIMIRAVKDEKELEYISKAADIADSAFSDILNFIRPGVSEIEIADRLEAFMKGKGASGISFDTIVASGVRSSLPHGVASDKLIEDGDFLTLDFGCIYNGYCSDMTRTIVVGKASDKQKKIYSIVLEAQLKALELVKPGEICKNIDSAARNVIADSGYSDYFGHGLGHGVGLEVHELPVLNPLGEIRLQENMVITDEPGIYIPDFGGVRIEDLVVVKQNGPVILSKSSKELIEL